MRTLSILALCAALTQLTGCVVDGVEAAQARPETPVAASASQPVAHEIHSMFADEKAKARQSELPSQF